MQTTIEKIKKHYVVSALVFASVVFAASNLSGISQLGSLISGSSLNSQPLFDSTNDFVLFASEELKLEQGVQISSGDLGSNKIVDIQKDVIANGNLFADKITLDKNSVINGSVSYNKLKTQKETQILGPTTTPVSLPIAVLPDIQDFQTGTQNFTFTGTSTANTLNSGNYRNITIEKNSRLTLAGGIYNLEKMTIKENSAVIFATSTTLNIKEEFFVQQKVTMLPGANVNFDDLKINFKSQKPVEFGKRSFLNFKLLASNAQVHIGEETTMRGQILAKKIKVEKNSIVSSRKNYAKRAQQNEIVQTSEGARFVVNHIQVDLSDNSTRQDAEDIVQKVNGKIIGEIPRHQLYLIEVPSRTVEELDTLIAVLENLNDPRIESVVENIMLQFE